MPALATLARSIMDLTTAGEPGGPAMDASPASHEPVMVTRITELLAVRTGPAVIVDATIGAAGHAAALLAASDETVHLVGFDRDPDALELARRRLAAYGD